MYHTCTGILKSFTTDMKRESKRDVKGLASFILLP